MGNTASVVTSTKDKPTFNEYEFMKFTDYGLLYDEDFNYRIEGLVDSILYESNMSSDNVVVTENLINILTNKAYNLIKSDYAYYNEYEFNSEHEYAICFKLIIRIIIVRLFKDRYYRFSSR